jgi:hypothetical protein
MATTSSDDNKNLPITDVLRRYSNTNPKKGQVLAEYLDYLEDCFCYQLQTHNE